MRYSDAKNRVRKSGVIVLPIHIKLLYGMVIGNAILHSVFNTKNQLDIKKYKQMIQPAFICSNSLIKKELRWVPKHNIYESVMKAANWYSEYEML
jgi:nucleoside-diphosphate-sugar epimerase